MDAVLRFRRPVEPLLPTSNSSFCLLEQRQERFLFDRWKCDSRRKKSQGKEKKRRKWRISILLVIQMQSDVQTQLNWASRSSFLTGGPNSNSSSFDFSLALSLSDSLVFFVLPLTFFTQFSSLQLMPREKKAKVEDIAVAKSGHNNSWPLQTTAKCPLGQMYLFFKVEFSKENLSNRKLSRSVEGNLQWNWNNFILLGRFCSRIEKMCPLHVM